MGNIILMYVPLLMIAGVVVLIAVCIVVAERTRNRIKELILERGGKIVGVTIFFVSPTQRTVRYIAAAGELRQATISTKRGGVSVVDDRPYQLVLRDEADSGLMLDELLLAAECMELPGYAAYAEIIRSLAQGKTQSVELYEQEQTEGYQPRFAPILQCLEAASIFSNNDGCLELTSDGQAVTVWWQVEGQPPQRLLQITAAPLTMGADKCDG
jgi:hypothetical protein